jgi:hypothetical protein
MAPTLNYLLLPKVSPAWQTGVHIYLLSSLSLAVWKNLGCQNKLVFLVCACMNQATQAIEVFARIPDLLDWNGCLWELEVYDTNI